MKDTVVVFARAPRLGAVKRRLARDIGDRAALRFHVATMTQLVRALAADRHFRTVLAVTPDHARFRLPARVARLAQGGGDLGVRMQRAFRRFRHGRVAIIGCDIPDAEPLDALDAFRALGKAQAAFGPAADGGYWLVAMSPRRPARPFTAVRWSTEFALADTLANFAGWRVAFLRTLHDVDTAADWHRLRPVERPWR
jgi:rSAM/selenodomain-associated transferase 1